MQGTWFMLGNRLVFANRLMIGARLMFVNWFMFGSRLTFRNLFQRAEFELIVECVWGLSVICLALTYCDSFHPVIRIDIWWLCLVKTLENSPGFSISWPCSLRAYSVVLFPFSGGELSLLPVPGSIQKMIWQMFGGFSGVVSATVAMPYHIVMPDNLGCDVADDLLHSKLLQFLVVRRYVRGLSTCWFWVRQFLLTVGSGPRLLVLFV